MIKLHTLPAPLRCTMPDVAIATGLFSGLLRPASGTWGSLLAFAIALWIFPHLDIATKIIVTFGTYWLGFVSISHLIQRQKLPPNDTNIDKSWIVIDEWVGIFISFLLCSTILDFTLALVLFRFFDILKPWPISWVDKHIKTVHGIMLDDVLAGIMALFLMGLWLYL